MSVVTTSPGRSLFASPLRAHERMVAKLIEEYEAKGFQVLFASNVAPLPEFLNEFFPDFVAVSPTEKVIVEVKSFDKVRPSGYWLKFADTVKAHKADGWRLRLLVNPHEEPGQDVSLEEIEAQLQEGEKSEDFGAPTGSLLLTWSALEAAMRHAARVNDVELPDIAATTLITRLYSDGILGRDEYDFLMRCWRTRFTLAHGFRDTINPSDLVELRALARRLAAMK